MSPEGWAGPDEAGQIGCGSPLCVYAKSREKPGRVFKKRGTAGGTLVRVGE